MMKRLFLIVIVGLIFTIGFVILSNRAKRVNASGFNEPSRVEADPELLFQDDFNDGNADGWITADPQNWYVENGEYVGDALTFTSTTSAGDINWTNYSLDVDMMGEAGIDKVIWFRYLNDATNYQVNIRSSFNDINICRGGGSICTAYPFPNTNNTWYHLKIIVEGAHILVYVNGTLLIDYVDTSGNVVTHGKIGFWGYYSKVHFDNVVVRKIGSLAISGPTSGAINTDHIFTAVTDPISPTLPITYTWSTTEHPPVTHSGDLTDTMTFSWASLGTKTITVTAENTLETITDTHQIEIKPDYIYLPITIKPCFPMYADDFSNPASGWPVVDNGDVRVEYINGEYRILVRPTQYGALVRPGFQAADYSVSASLRNPNGVDGSYGIIFGIASDWSTFYTLEIYPDGWYGIYRYNPSNVTPLAEAFSPAIYQGTATNQIKVVRNGASINAYANGQLLASVIDSNYMGSRYVGLVAFSYDQPNVDIRFDNFTVYSSSCVGINSALSETSGGFTLPSQRIFTINSIEKIHPMPQR